MGAEERPVIAAMCGADHKTVGDVRKELGGPQPSVRIGADGRKRLASTRTGATPQLALTPQDGRNPDVPPQVTAREVGSGQTQTPELPTGEIPQLAPPETEESNDQATGRPDEQVPNHIVATTDFPTAAGEVVRIIQPMLTNVDPEKKARLLAAIPDVLAIDPSLDAETLITTSLAWGFAIFLFRPDMLRNHIDALRFALRGVPPNKSSANEGEQVTRQADSADAPAIRTRVRPQTQERKESLVNTMRCIIGPEDMDPQQVLAQLDAIGAAPNSSDPLQFVRFTLSSESDVFCRVEEKRGYYRLHDGDPYRAGPMSFDESQVPPVLAECGT